MMRVNILWTPQASSCRRLLFDSLRSLNPSPEERQRAAAVSRLLEAKRQAIKSEVEVRLAALEERRKVSLRQLPWARARRACLHMGQPETPRSFRHHMPPPRRPDSTRSAHREAMWPPGDPSLDIVTPTADRYRQPDWWPISYANAVRGLYTPVV